MSGTDPGVIMGHMARQLWNLATPEANMLKAVNHVDIVKTWIEQAKKSDGFRDRESFLKANGEIPIPSNQTIHLHKHFAVAQEGKTPTLPSFEADLDPDDNLPPRLPSGKS
jgi:hypothetical protein